MGKDIHLNIVKDGTCIAKEIFDGRNYEWFSNIADSEESLDREYAKYPLFWGMSPQAPADWNEKKLAEDGYYDFRYVNVGAFKKWFKKYKPNLNAGWVPMYDKWLMETKGITPAEEPYRYLPEDARPGEYFFIEYENPYDCSNWLYNYLIDNNIPDEADLCYWFDW